MYQFTGYEDSIAVPFADPLRVEGPPQRRSYTNPGSRVVPDLTYESPNPVECPACNGDGGDVTATGVRPCSACDGAGYSWTGDLRKGVEFAPGSWQKMAVLQMRYAAGVRLNHRDDRKNYVGLFAEGVPVSGPEDATEEEEEIDIDEFDLA